MESKLPWYTHLALNSYSLGLNISAGSTPVLLPFLIVMYMPADYKNTYLATIRVVGLAVAMLVQPLAGYLSDRSLSRFGRRRPFIFASAVLNVAFLAVMGASTMFMNSPLDGFFQTTFAISAAFAILFLGNILQQISSNIGQGALQGLIPDIVPESQRGFSSGVKSTFEVLPILLLIVIGPLVQAGKIWLVIGIIMAGFVATMLLTIFFVKETPNTVPATDSLREPVLRLVALMVIFVAITQAAVWLVQFSSGQLVQAGASQAVQVIVVGLTGLAGMAGAIFLGVYSGARMGIGKEANQHRPFIWWIVNRLLFLAAVTGIRDFAQNYLRDVIKVENPVSASSYLLAAIGVFLVIAALVGGYLSDRFGRRRLITIAGLVAGIGAIVIIFARSMPMIYVAGGIVGLGAGLFMASNWALGTSLVPPKEAGKFLGISNLAGAGAGIVATGIGGPMIDSFNKLNPGIGYLVVFAIYAALFFISVLVLSRVKPASAVL
ncbi:MAG TPA: MFS transporter [Anaerolineaceae bacterium]